MFLLWWWSPVNILFSLSLSLGRVSANCSMFLICFDLLNSFCRLTQKSISLYLANMSKDTMSQRSNFCDSDRFLHNSGLIVPTPTKELGFLSPRRRPLNPTYSPGTTSQDSRSNTFSSRSREPVSTDKETYKRWVHKHAERDRKDTYLCQRRVIMKTRRVDVVVLPPKRIRMDDWCPQRVSELYHPSDRHIFGTSRSSASKGKETCVNTEPSSRQFHRNPEEPIKIFTASLADTMESNGDKGCGGEPTDVMSSFTVGRVEGSAETSRKCVSTEVTNTKLPWNDWPVNGFSEEAFQDALLSGELLNAVVVIETDDHILIKFEPVGAVKDTPISEVNAPKPPLSLLGKIMKWVAEIGGN